MSSSASTIFHRDWKRDGSIFKVHDRDDVDHMAPWKRYLFYTTPLMVLLSLLTYWAYFTLRIICVISAQRAQHETYPMAWIFIAVELSVAIPTFLHLFMVMFILNPRKRPKLRLMGDDVPAVDVFITCCKEETELILDTTRAACEIDYPADRFRVVILDDGRDNDLQEEAEKLSQVYPNLHYLAREKLPGVPHHFKAGNLNYGFREVAKMDGGPAHFAAALDADMIPERHWLRAIMPHMLSDERMALACPPQVCVPK
jgi:cellulose synthase/poly-beta-1,6-N-acetylglucosamine synthase-like glycosyltransferase